MTNYLNHIQLSESGGKRAKSHDIEFILSELGVKFSIYKSKEEFDSTCIYNIKDIKNASSNDLTFCSLDDVEKAIMIISKCNAKAILCHQLLEGLVYPRSGKQQCLIFVKNPRMVMMKIINEIYYSHSFDKKKRTSQNDKIASAPLTLIISKSARIGKNCSIGNFTKIGNKCTIGDNTVVGDRVTIEQNTRIGKNCIIQPGTVIGNNVEICSNCSIARGSLSDTIIGEGTKIDALVHVAHNVEIGRNCALTAGTIIGGSTRIGDMCWTGLNSTIKHKVKIGNKVIIGSGASVINDIDDEDIVAGVPAKSIKYKVRSNQL